MPTCVSSAEGDDNQAALGRGYGAGAKMQSWAGHALGEPLRAAPARGDGFELHLTAAAGRYQAVVMAASRPAGQELPLAGYARYSGSVTVVSMASPLRRVLRWLGFTQANSRVCRHLGQLLRSPL